MIPDILVLSDDSSPSDSEHKQKSNKLTVEELSLTPPFPQNKSDGEISEKSGDDSSDETDSSDSSDSTSSSSKCSPSNGMCNLKIN